MAPLKFVIKVSENEIYGIQTLVVQRCLKKKTVYHSLI